MSTKQQYLYTVTVDGQVIGVFDTMTGGDALAPSAKHRPGGMGPEKSFAALASYSTVTVSRVYERERDHALLKQLTGKAGLVKGSVSEQPLGSDGKAWGKPTIYAGRFLGVKRGDGDSTSSDPRMFELDIDPVTVT